jgi:hypothetical protein
MIRMVVGHQDAHDIRKIQTHLPKASLDHTRRNARIDEDTSLTRAQIVAVSATTAGKTPKNEFFFVHNNLSDCKGTTFF